jgi:short-subunit dehydrogenase
MPNEMNGPFAVVTGASSGIGLELARQFAQHGYDLLICAENAEIERAAQELRREGHKVDAVQVDLASYDGVEQLYREIQRSGRAVDAIAINAGIGVGGPFVETDLEKELNLLRLNVLSTVHLAKRVVVDMHARNEGRILFTSSIAAEAPGPFEAIYSASKAFVQSFAEALRNELKETAVHVTALQPGATDTPFFAKAELLDTKVGAGPKSDPADVARKGFEALMKNKDHVVAAMAKEKAMVGIAKVTPETASAEMRRKMSEPGSADSA